MANILVARSLLFSQQDQAPMLGLLQQQGDPEMTVVPPELQAAFQAWVKANQIADLDNPDSHYDYRGAFLAGLNRDGKTQHWPDTFKQHGHPTFSIESKYSKGPNDGGHWVGNTFVPPQPKPRGR